MYCVVVFRTVSDQNLEFRIEYSECRPKSEDINEVIEVPPRLLFSISGLTNIEPTGVEAICFCAVRLYEKLTFRDRRANVSFTPNYDVAEIKKIFKTSY